MQDQIDPADAEAQAAARALQEAGIRADPDTIRLLFTAARTHYGWQDRPVPQALLEELYAIACMGPTSMNQQPMRIVFVTSDSARQKLLPCLAPGNRPKTASAPVTAILGNDSRFYEQFDRIFPINPGAQKMFRDDPSLAESNAMRNGTLQGAYFMIAARAVGLDVGPMSGFDAAQVDAAFFADTPVRSNFLCNLGYGDPSKLFRRLPRLDFDTVCRIL